METKKERAKFGLIVMITFGSLSLIFLRHIPDFIDLGFGIYGIIFIISLVIGFYIFIFILGYIFESEKDKELINNKNREIS